MKNFLWALVIVIVLGGAYMLWQGGGKNSGEAVTPTPAPVAAPGAIPSPTPSPTPGQATPSPAASAMTATVSYSGTGFTPNEVTIKKGGMVTWKNASNGKMWVASAQHPSHTVYAGTSRQEHCPDTAGTAFDQCAGETGDFSFTFGKVGTWNYHDHMNATVFGKVTVVE